MDTQNWLQNARKTVAQWLMPPNDPTSEARAALEALAKRRGMAPAPESPYKDSIQIGIKAQATFKPGDFVSEDLEVIFSKEGETDQTVSLYTKSASELNELLADGWKMTGSVQSQQRTITARGLTRIYRSFKPTKAILTETVYATYSGPGPDFVIVETVDDAADAVLYMAFCGADNCFPNAPIEENGIAGPTFGSKSVGNGISWPTINGGIDITVAFAIERSVLSRAKGPLPPGYDPVPRYMKVVLRFNLLGPALR